MVDVLILALIFLYNCNQNSSDKQNKEENCKKIYCKFPFRFTFATCYINFGMGRRVWVYSKRNLILVKIKSWWECYHEWVSKDHIILSFLLWKHRKLTILTILIICKRVECHNESVVFDSDFQIVESTFIAYTLTRFWTSIFIADKAMLREFVNQSLPKFFENDKICWCRVENYIWIFVF